MKSALKDPHKNFPLRRHRYHEIEWKWYVPMAKQTAPS